MKMSRRYTPISPMNQKNKNQVIIGIDPGTTRIGYGVVSFDGRNITCLSYGLIENKSKDSAEQFRNTKKKIEGLISRHQPSRFVVEKLFFFKNQKTIIAVSEMRGIIILTLANNKIPLYEFTPLQVKQGVSSYGRAGKEQVQQMVRLILGIKERIRPDDAADALAIAICCANSYNPFNQ